MDDPVVSFISILNDNNIVAKYREIPEEFEHADELLADIEFEYDGELPDSMRYFELNGFSSPVDLEEFLDHGFNSFKISIISNSFTNQDTLFHEIQDKITKAREDLLLQEQSLKTLDDITLNSLIKYKIQACDNVLQLITAKPAEKDEQVLKKNHEKKNIYVFRIKKEIRNSDYVIRTLHKELKLKGYIVCTLPQFRKLFTTDPKSDQSIEPVMWKCKTYYHFSYFIQCLHRNLLAYSRNPSNNTIARKLFYSVEGVPFTTKRERFDSNSAKTRDIKAVFDKIMKTCGLINPTTEKKKPTF